MIFPIQICVSNDYIVKAYTPKRNKENPMGLTAKKQNEAILKAYDEYKKSLEKYAPELLDKNNFSTIFCTGVPTV